MRMAVPKKYSIFPFVNTVIMIFLITITLYPLLYVLFASVSDPNKIMMHSGLLLCPQGFTVSAYKMVFRNPMVLIGYGNTLIYVVCGTAINMLMTVLLAYMLSRRDLLWKNFFTFLIVFTMFFNGGLIPNFLLVKSLGILNTRWALLLPGAISTWNLLVMRTSFQSIPQSLEESAKIDGANEPVILFKIIIPVSMPVIAVMVLFYGVGIWNEWFNAMIYINDRDLYPLQLVLREILIENSTDDMMTNLSDLSRGNIGEIIKYAVIVVATLPILMVYPFLQKYFVKGIMIGAIKG